MSEESNISGLSFCVHSFHTGASSFPYYYSLPFNFITSLHELYRMPKGKVDHKEMMKNAYAAPDQSSTPKNDLFELVWENGQISMQAQSSSNRAKKNQTFASFQSHSPMSPEKVSGYGKETITRIGKFEEDVMVPWLNCIYGMDDSLQHRYSPGFFHELSGGTMNEVSLLDRSLSNCNQVFGDAHKHHSRHVLNSEQGILSNGSSVAAQQVDTSGSGSKANNSQLYIPSLLHQCEPSFASIRSRESNIAENNTSNATQQQAPCGVISQVPPKSSGFPMEEKYLDMSSNHFTSMNFTHFGKPVAIVKPNLQSIDLSSMRSASVGIKNKSAVPASRSNPPESTQVDLSGECPKKLAMHSQNKKAMKAEPRKVGWKPLEPKFIDLDAVVSTPACKDTSKFDQLSNQVFFESGMKGQEAVKECMDPAVVSSSVCSGNGAERVSEYPYNNSKQKSRDTENSEFNSEEIEDELVGVKREANGRGGMGSKRHRSAEVHNLSERRRRDRINEKMRRLQELIPNCNKADKASMLDEAIEYLKTLQLHLQIMSMGGGLFMPGMMLHAGMQHMHAALMSPFSPISIGMQMGFGLGYGNVNNGSSSRFPMVQMPQLQGTHHVPVALAHTSGPASFHGMAGPNPQMFGLSMPVPCTPMSMFSFPGVSLMNPSAAAGLTENVEPASVPKLKDPMPNGGFEQSSLVPGKEDNLVWD